METILYRSEDRGIANYGWLQAKYYFSFSQYHDPAKMGFGLLRVLNDDIVAPNTGFDTHPHRDMEIITLPQSGAVTHKDSTGSKERLTAGEVQVMTAGKGILHSEHNKDDEELNLFQLWIFPREKNLKPDYAQRRFDEAGRENKLQLIVSPNKDDDALFVNQDAWLHLADFTEDGEINYKVNKEGNGVFVLVIDGNIAVADEELYRRDAIGISEAGEFTVKAKSGTRLLFVEVPMS